MKHLLLVCSSLMILISGCEGWTVQPIPYITPTPFPSRTPSIYTATPIILLPSTTLTSTITPASPTQTIMTPTDSAALTSTDTPTTPTITSTATSSPPSIKVEILGCTTSLDISHGMGEVTNAYVTISNLGAVDTGNLCATLNGLDEGRPHPDKTVCASSLPAKYQVTLKLTIDTTYKVNTPIQVDVSANDVLLQRVGQDSCRDIGIFSQNVEDLGVVKPIP